MYDCRQEIILRTRDIGYVKAFPKTDVMKSWRKPKSMEERLARQNAWIQGRFDKSEVPVCYDIDRFDDQTLLVFFEQTIRQSYRGVGSRINARPLSHPKACNLEELGGKWYVEFSLYDGPSNSYALPDMSVVEEWAKDNDVSHERIAATFMVFDSETDAILCSLRFR